MANAKHLTSPAGLVQILHLVFGAIAVGCGAVSYESQFFKDRFFIWSVVTCLIVSVVLLILHVISGNQGVRVVSAAIHVIGGFVLLTAGTLMVLSVGHIKNNLCLGWPWGDPNEMCNWDKDKKLAAASFGIINGIFYLLGAVLIIMVKSDDDEAYLEGGDSTRKFARPSK